LDLDKVWRFDDLFEFPEIETFSHGFMWYSNDKLSPSRERSQAGWFSRVCGEIRNRRESHMVRLILVSITMDESRSGLLRPGKNPVSVT